MIVHDISVTVTPQTVTWDGTEQGLAFDWTQQITPDVECSLSVVRGSVHTGTHMDAPSHFVEGGKSIDALDVRTLVGPVQIVEIYGRDVIRESDMERVWLPPGTKRVLFKTDNTQRRLLSQSEFHKDYVGLSPGAALWLVSHGVELVGIDYLSVGPYGDANTETHRILLAAGVVVVETLCLEGIAPGEYFLAALPPKFAGVEGSPCRALLIEGMTEKNERDHDG